MSVKIDRKTPNSVEVIEIKYKNLIMVLVN
jgi:hypothetical protein